MYWIANWKMNGTMDFVSDFMRTFISHDIPTQEKVILCPAFPYLSMAHHFCAGTDISIAGQNCSDLEKGAFTGEVSAQMLEDVGCEYVILGHSERRQKAFETERQLKHKCEHALERRLKIIYCIGETEDEKNKGLTEPVLHRQLQTIAGFCQDHFLIAYEPVWAIGTGAAADLETIKNTKDFLLKTLQGQKQPKIPILYGGSVSTKNVKDLHRAGCDGYLIGGASLNCEDFWRIVTSTT